MRDDQIKPHDVHFLEAMGCDEPDKSHHLKLLAQRILETRQKRGLSLESLAYSVGISKGNLSDIENLKRNPRYTTLVAIAEGLDLTISELLDGI